jgi:hypothetical protein
MFRDVFGRRRRGNAVQPGGDSEESRSSRVCARDDDQNEASGSFRELLTTRP